MVVCDGCNKQIKDDQEDVTNAVGIRYHRACYDKTYYDKYEKLPPVSH